MADSIHTLASDNLTVTVLPDLGARLHSLEAFGLSLLRTPTDIREHRRNPFFWGGYHMAPWCNRIDATPTKVGNDTVDLPANFPGGSAIHGQVSAAPWNALDQGAFTVSGGGHGWPWTYDVTLQLAVHASSVTLNYTLTNTSETPMPAGVGFHPWFRQPTTVRIPAQRVYPNNVATEPTPIPVSAPFDLRMAGALPGDVDATWTDLTDYTVELSWADHDVWMTLHAVVWPTRAVVAAAQPAQLDAAAVELQTHAPSGLRRLLHAEPDPMQLLDPENSLTLELTMTFRDRPTARPAGRARAAVDRRRGMDVT